MFMQKLKNNKSYSKMSKCFFDELINKLRYNNILYDVEYGDSEHIVTTKNGQTYFYDFYIGEDADYTEKFTCETCGTKLNIEAVPSFIVSVDNKEEDYDNDYETVVDKPKKIKLNEVDIFND